MQIVYLIQTEEKWRRHDKRAYELEFEDEEVISILRNERWNAILNEGILGVIYRVTIKVHGV